MVWSTPFGQELPYAVVFAIAAFAIPVLFFWNASIGMRLWLGGINAAVNAVVGFIGGLVFFLSMPSFATEWSAGNVVPKIGGLIFLALTTSFAAYWSGDDDGYSRDSAGLGAKLSSIALWVLGVGMLAWLIGSLMLFVEPSHVLFNDRGGTWCDPSGTEHMLSLFQPTNAKPGELQDADPNHLIQVTEGAAMVKAKQVLPGNIGSYLQPGTAYLQKVDNTWSYVIDLKPTNFQTFNNAGAAAPGYIVVSAEDPNAQAVYRSGFKIRYVPDYGLFDNDLDRHVYYDFTLKMPGASALWIDDLHGMEIRDGDGRPFYTGTLMKPVVGITGEKVVGMIAVDAQTGEITWWHSVSEIPSWVDRIYPEDYMKSLASDWWAKYANHYVCNFFSQLGQVSVDSSSYQLTGHGNAQYVFTYTSPNTSDNSILGELVVNPTTGSIVNVPLKGATEPAAESTIQKKLQQVSQKAQLDTDLCQLQQIYSQYAWYCVINQGDTFTGVALLDTRYTTDPAKVLYAPDLTTLVGLYQQQLSGTSSGGTITNTAGTLSLTGTVTHLSSVLVNQGGTDYRVFQMHGTGIPDNAVFWIAMPNSTAALMQVGDTVTVVVNAPGGKLTTDQHMVVSSLEDKNLPAGTPQG